ncbi:MAG: hypothetical protein ACXW1D_00425 [Halobacteriota archaeon]
MTNSIDNNGNTIDSRDIIARIEELEGDRASLVDEVEVAKENVSNAYEDRGALDTKETTAAHHEAMDEENEARKNLAEWDLSEDAEELAKLKTLAEQCEGYGDWGHGETLISEDYFTEYAQELAEDCGMVNKDTSWPNNHIDWDAAAEELKNDYMEVDFDGTTYLMRA